MCGSQHHVDLIRRFKQRKAGSSVTFLMLGPSDIQRSMLEESCCAGFSSLIKPLKINDSNFLKKFCKRKV